MTVNHSIQGSDFFFLWMMKIYLQDYNISNVLFLYEQNAACKSVLSSLKLTAKCFFDIAAFMASIAWVMIFEIFLGN